MKSTKEIHAMLVPELFKHLDAIRDINQKLPYYNEILGGTSFLLAGLLWSVLKKSYREWRAVKWIDDSLITGIKLTDAKLEMDGVMIWGRINTTEQWTEPFSFEVELNETKKSGKWFVFCFSDLDMSEITYEEFKDNREYWAENNRNWKYIINSSEIL